MRATAPETGRGRGRGKGRGRGRGRTAPQTRLTKKNPDPADNKRKPSKTSDTPAVAARKTKKQKEYDGDWEGDWSQHWEDEWGYDWDHETWGDNSKNWDSYAWYEGKRSLSELNDAQESKRKAKAKAKASKEDEPKKEKQKGKTPKVEQEKAEEKATRKGQSKKVKTSNAATASDEVPQTHDALLSILVSFGKRWVGIPWEEAKPGIRGALLKASACNTNIYWTRCSAGVRSKNEQQNVGYFSISDGDLEWGPRMAMVAKCAELLATRKHIALKKSYQLC